jgi:AraC-like DNA-binding protein
MQQTVSSRRSERLEGLCEGRPGDDRISIRKECDGIERLEARFRGVAFSPHRHDTYAIGVTLSGVQAFYYRGEARRCMPGQCHILHPDEIHDGSAGTEDGFAYRICYIDPSLVQEALGGRPLPFVSNPVVDLADPQKLALAAAWEMSTEIDDFGRIEFAVTVADLLRDLSPDATKPSPSLQLSGLLRVRSLIAERPRKRHGISELERTADLDRWSLARQFRAAFGTSPSRFRTMRQLDQVRRFVKSGASLADAALQAGFADQSHMSRQFKRAYGLTPARWASALL